MKLIKNAIVYSAELPSAEHLKHHLAEHPFSDPAPSQRVGWGFVEVPGSGGELVATFPRGLAFSFRLDEKRIPSQVLKAEVEKRAKLILDETGRKPKGKALKALKEEVSFELYTKVFPRTSVATCFYDTENKYLIVAAAAKGLADATITQLIHAVGSVKTTTIHISDLKGGLTTRLKTWLGHESGEFSDGDAFGDAPQVGDAVTLERSADKKEKVTFSLSHLGQAPEGLAEALNHGFEVTQLAMGHGLASFQLTREFRFKGIEFGHEPPADDLEDVTAWQTEASIQTLELSAAVKALCDLLGYKPPEEPENPEDAEE